MDDGKTIYCWNGIESTKRERVKAAEIARKIKDEERGGKAKVIIIDADRDNDVHFFTALGGKIYQQTSCGQNRSMVLTPCSKSLTFLHILDEDLVG